MGILRLPALLNPKPLITCIVQTSSFLKLQPGMDPGFSNYPAWDRTQVLISPTGDRPVIGPRFYHLPPEIGPRFFRTSNCDKPQVFSNLPRGMDPIILKSMYPRF
jgi:hypothetical protein